MITKQRTLFYFVGDTPFRDLAEAQKHDLKLLADAKLGEKWEAECKEELADWLLKNSTAIVDILTTTPTSRLKARKSHGGSKKSRPKLQPIKIEP